MRQRWDIFCRVIDNFGDIGVCWRLARQLANEFGKEVRLWVDDLSTLAPLHPEVSDTAEMQDCDGVQLRTWPPHGFPDVTAADVVIEAFACELPENYVQAMARCQPAPYWLNLEYLSAESWVEGCHGMRSPHPALPLAKIFYFPGFSPRTGGLLREKDLFQRQAACGKESSDDLRVSLFAYSDAPLDALFSAMRQSKTRVRCLAFAGKTADAIARKAPEALLASEQLVVDIQPFVPQADFDQLLWQQDINFVRGEDSFVRAQWAARPFVWQIYRQEDDAHLDKLAAFLDLYCADLDAASASAVRELFFAWNGRGNLALAWPNYVARLPELRHHAVAWAAQLAQQPDLTTNLVNFCAAKV